MLRPRITPCLLIKNGGLVKTVQFENPKYVGDPVNAVKIFNEKEADELIVLDIDATTLAKEPNFRLIGQLAAECRMPLCYGGGVRTVEQAKKIVSFGVEKVAISAAAIEDPTLISDIARDIGQQSVAVVFDVRRAPSGAGYEVWTHNGTRHAGRFLSECINTAESFGAGEIIVNSIDNDGTMGGFDLALAGKVRSDTRLPMTILGGAGSLADIRQVISVCGVVGVAAGSLFVFKGPYRAVLISYPTPERKEELLAAVVANHSTVA